MPAILRRLRVAATLLVVTTACAGDRANAPRVPGGDATATRPVAPLATRGMPNLPNGHAYGHVASCSHRDERTGTAVIGPRGGTLRIGSDYLFVPAGALESRVQITGRVPEGSVAEIEFEPHGLRFAHPVFLVLDAAGCSVAPSDEPVLLFLGVDGAVLERIEGFFDPAAERLTAPIEHFSTYAVGV